MTVTDNINNVNPCRELVLHERFMSDNLHTSIRDDSEMDIDAEPIDFNCSHNNENMSITGTCLCQRVTGPSDPKIQCEAADADELCPGSGYYHPRCIKLDENEVKFIEKFICSDCNLRTGEKTKYKTIDGDKTVKRFVVEKIVGHAINTRTRKVKYLVKWEGYPDTENTYEPELNLTACYEHIANYRKTTSELDNYPLSFKPTGGADQSIAPELYNENNWPELEQMKTKTLQLLAHERYQTDLELIACLATEKLTITKDSLIIWLHGSHYYAILWLKSQDKVIISDAVNATLSEDRKQEIEKILGHEILPFKVNNRVKVDYCGAATVSAIVELSRMYKTGNFCNGNINFTKTIYERATTLHPEVSQPAPGRNDIRNIRRTFNCSQCDFKTTKGRAGLLRHMQQKKHL